MKFDIFYYLRKIKNINLLNKILFEDHQKNLLKFICQKYGINNNLLHNQKKREELTEERFLEIIKGLNENDRVDTKIYEEVFLETMVKNN